MTVAPREQASSRILVVEDNADLRRVLTEILQFEGFTIVSVASGEAGLDKMREMVDAPHLILTDILLDGMDGCEFLRILRNSPSWQRIPVIFLSGQHPLQAICGPDGLQPDAYVEKPFNIADLVQTIRRTLDITS
jgi:CheY-like chemotaxis protein